jgi:biotin carboxylase
VKRLLLAGGGHGDIPMIRAAKSLGYTVFTSGNREDDLGHSFGDGFHVCDFSDRQALLALAQRLNITAICPSCNDFSALSSAYVAEQLGLPGHDSVAIAETLHHKDRYREFSVRVGIPTPRARGFDTFEAACVGVDGLRFPLIVKPVDLSGGKGVTKVTDPSEVSAALHFAFTSSQAKRVVVEEFIEGSRHGFSAFLRGGRVEFSFLDNEFYYINPFLVSAACAPSGVEESVRAELVVYSETIARALNLVDGLFHVQFILNGETPYIIEVTRRPPGDLYVQLVEKACLVNYPKWIVKAFCGLGIEEVFPAPVSHCISRHCVMSDRAGTVQGLLVDPQVAPLIVDARFLGKVGDTIENIMTYKYGIVFLRFDTSASMNLLTPQLQDLIKVKVC